jgi:hypothetical protein
MTTTTAATAAVRERDTDPLPCNARDLSAHQRLRTTARPAPPPTPADGATTDGPLGWAVRMDWSDGTHTLVGFTRRRARAERRSHALARWWAPGPVRPCRYQVVTIRREQ